MSETGFLTQVRQHLVVGASLVALINKLRFSEGLLALNSQESVHMKTHSRLVKEIFLVSLTSFHYFASL